MAVQLDEFWNLIDQARASAAAGSGGTSPYQIAAQLRALLARRSAEDIYGYLEQQARLMRESYSWALWGAAYVANGGCSDDGFDYFRGWLFSQGRDVFERALRDPDSISELVDEVDEAWCEDMIGAAVLAYQEVTGDYPKGPAIKLPALGPSWDFEDPAEMKKRYPKLCAKFLR